MRDGQGSAAAIGRSLRTYYDDPARMQRMDALHAQFVPKDGLAFDVGAHVGDRTASFLRLGASVVALEPQPRVFRALRLIHGRKAGVRLVPEAVGSTPGQIAMRINSGNPTVSTLSDAFIDATIGAPMWAGQVWDRSIAVPVTTLDRLIAQHGNPDFIKIDVEGHELDVLMGLSRPVSALSFEFTTIQRAVACACLKRLGALGAYAFNLSMGEEHRLRHTRWVDAAQMQAELLNVPDAANSGDVHARLL